MGFYLYKGLKKPLVLYGLKDKYIYYALGCAVAGLIGGMLLSQVFNLIVGLIWIGIFGGTIYYLYRFQDKNGLFSKTKNHDEIYIFPKKFKTSIILKNKAKVIKKSHNS
ncbi:hypothetical protein SAMN05660493_01552 [Epilithonimonas bovis DSM 19482]|uniref:DUF4133 domain-containing protein n=1 Tax=Epilithonimonas bovis DSM 19482 TaxID=1121284 RepID=A0A1U7PVY0_9FLAO|nr:hypothetical protein [Epilithonimonas bovis]SIT96857.1 hypothetical protein SAMN05660493_01552 [Epilithonimonas bovis DSM 19482]